MPWTVCTYTYVRRVLDGLAQPPDVDVDRARGGEVLVAPDLLGEHLAGRELARSLGERDEELELLEAQA